MNFWEVTAANMVSTAITVIFIVIEALILLGKPGGGDIRYWVRVFGASVLFIVGCAVLGAAMLKLGWMQVPYLSDGLIEYSQILSGMLLLMALYGREPKLCWFTMLIISVTASVGSYMGLMLMPMQIIHLDVMRERLLYMFFLWGVSPMCLILVLVVLHRTGAGLHYRQWLNDGVIRKDMLIFLSAWPLLLTFVERMIEQFELDNGGNCMITILLLVWIYMVFMYISRQDIQKRRIEAQQVSLQQQTVYIENLESLQQEVRQFRHDFKNMMSGMYLQVKEGDMTAVQSLIQDMTADFDNQVGEQIKLMNQLANIHHLEMKSLLLTKLEQMRQDGIRYDLEVMRVFEKTRLRGTDLCRCLGILLDNAMEAVWGRADGRVHIMISSQENYTTLLVKNTLYEAVDFHKIGTKGYTTKGDGRGIGLNSYRQILSQYDYVLSLTTIKDGYFIQELKIMER